MERCACCDRPLSSPFKYGGWCEGCMDGLLRDVNMLTAGTPDDVRVMAAILLDRGCITLAHYVTKVPFQRVGVE